MAEVASSTAACTVVGFGGIAAAACMPQIDLNAVVGSFVGSLVFVLWAKELSLLQRVGYLIAGWVGGYFAAAEILAQAWTKTSGITSFGCGLVTVLASVGILEYLKTGKWMAQLLAAIGRLLPRRGE